jgi:hypothetical protein
MMTPKGIEDFSFRTQENQIQNINAQIRNARISGASLRRSACWSAASEL